MDYKIDQILLYLYNCLDYGLSNRAKRGLFISEYFNHWKKELNAKELKSVTFNLNREKLIEEREYKGSVIISLTEKGKLRALNFSFRRLCNKKENWDGKWRLITFDIPNKCKKGREALVYRFRIGGFYRLQESLFLYPYDCEKEIRALVELFKLKKYVRFGILESIDNEEEIRKKMKLS